MDENPLLQPEHFSGLRPQSTAGRTSGSTYFVEDGVLVDAADFYNHQSREAVEATFPLDFRGGGPDPRVDTTTVTVRYR